VVLFLWAVPLETAPLLFRDLDSLLLAFLFSFQLLVLLMMTTKIVFATVLALSQSTPVLGPGSSGAAESVDPS